mmetsp:Transcript_66909/g.211764  ORF Transcript_66909/g.211764 Transcript_66909/m.211764 type:complete len:428 (+) Transcript_66909:146-1429(+)
MLLLELQPADGAEMHLVRPVCIAQPARPSQGGGKHRVLREAHGSVRLHSTVGDRLDHHGHDKLHHGQLLPGSLAPLPVDPCRCSLDQHPGLVNVGPGPGNVGEDGVELGELLAEGRAVLHAAAHGREGPFGRAQEPHAVMDPAWAQASLGNLEAAALACEDVGKGDPHILEQHLKVPLGRLVIAQHLHRPHKRDTGRVHRHEDDGGRSMTPRLCAWSSCPPHEDADLAVQAPGSRDPPLAAVDDVLAGGLIPHYRGADVGGVARGHARLGHGEARADAPIQQRLQPALLLLHRAEAGDGLHVPRVRRGAVHCLCCKLHVVCSPHDLAEGAVLEVREATALVAGAQVCHLGKLLGKPEVPEAAGLCLLLQLHQHRRVGPLIGADAYVVRLRPEALLVWVDLLAHEVQQFLPQLLVGTLLHLVQPGGWS